MRLTLPLRRGWGRPPGRRAGTPRLEYVERRVLLSTFTVETAADDGPGSLRWAITQANADLDAGPSSIRFAIPGSGLQTIRLQSPLAPITRPVLIEGRSQPGYTGTPLIRLDGSSAQSSGSYGLVVAGGGSLVAGLAVTGFSGAGILLTGPGGDFVESSYVGLVPGIPGAAANGEGIVVLGSSNNTIGGPAGQGNVISGNRGAGVRVAIVTPGDSTGNAITGNLIGTDGAGVLAVGNGQDGVVFAGASYGRITGNVVSGNFGNGITLNGRATGHVILGNVVGLTADGQAALGNNRDGILVDDAPGNVIGGLVADEANQISANRGSGVRARNDSAGLQVLGNQIGVDATATRPFGNQGDGLTLGSSGVKVGGEDSGAGNVIAYNGVGTTGAGVQLVGLVSGDTILSNRIFKNAGLGINLNNGPTPNHTPGQFIGPNGWANYPILTSAVTDGLVTSSAGSLTGMPLQSYTIQFFWTDAPDRSGFGEGERLLGSTETSAGDDGRASFAIPIPSSTDGGFLSATATDAAGNTSEFSQAILIRPYTDLDVALTADPTLAPQGSAVTFRATVTNRGHLTASNVSLAAQLPATAAVLSSTGVGGVMSAEAAGSFRLAVGSLAPGASAVLVVALQPPAGFSGDFTGTATATTAEPDSHPGDESAVATARLTPVVDVAVALASGPSTALRGDSLVYVLSASNAGPGTATGVVLTFPIGPGASYVAATGDQGAGRIDGGRLIIDLGSLGPGATATFVITLRADAVGVFASTASLATDEYQADAANDAVSFSTEILGQADLAVAMQAPPLAADDHDLVYAVVVANNGPDAARNVVLLDLIPALSTFDAAWFDGGSTSFADGIVTARLDALDAGAAATLWIRVRPTAAAGATLTNAARASSDEPDSDPSDNADWRRTEVRPVADLGATIAPDSPTVVQGQAATFRIRVSNQGPSPEPDALLTVPLPDWAVLASAVATQGGPATVANGVVGFRLGTLAVGGWAEATIALTARPTAAGPLILTANVQGWDIDFNPADDTASAVVTGLPAADLAVYVTPPPLVHERSTFQYTLTAANLSPLATGGVQLAAPLPAGVEFVSAVASQGAAPVLDSGRVVANLGDLAGSSTAAMTITVRPTSPAGTALLLSGVATSDLPDPASGNDVGRYAVYVAPAVDLMVRLQTLQPSVELGGDVTWVAQVWNSSPTTATGVDLSIPFEACGIFVGSATTQGSVQASASLITAALGTIGPWGNATVAFVLRPQAVGPAVLTVLAAADQFDSGPDDDRSTAALNVLEPPGTLQFAVPAVAVPETAGFAYVPVQRVGGARGTVTVRYRTTTGTASPGVDYVPVSGVLTFQPGQTLATIAVPVLAYPHNRGDESVAIVLEGATDGAVLGGLATASVTIQDVDPDYVPPAVGRVRLLGDPNSIGGLSIAFSEPLDRAAALDGAAYTLYDLGPNGVFGDGDDAPIAYLAPGYDPATQTVYLTPAAPMALGRQYAIVVRGAGPAGLVDLAGNPLGGGVDFVGLFARGTTLNYTDSNGDAVSLQVKSGGFMDLIRGPSGDARLLTLQGAVPGKTTLSGSVSKPRGRGDGVTPIDAIEGLGSFGDVRVSLKSPPFISSSLPATPARGGRPPVAAQGRAVALARRIPGVK
ncbi:Calx-beta domain-containing protein [Paludisphaera mucosa]|uniref:Calx-beta domain-containing protein n=1 Tax=Paludisphaera mucosa TaxID=3030827 RepID=A0ABT6FGA3_9BACT|nr:Calx-beta domain-containing protein [Paludisphaera mucosa]MDG3006608.1 Calx-beta domain-containing protein [Paludisphaera mucosa]